MDTKRLINIESRKNRGGKISRADFMRLLGSSVVGLAFWPQQRLPAAAGAHQAAGKDDLVETIFSESFVFDGCGPSLSINRGKEKPSFLFVPGEVKRLTGIDAGTRGVHVGNLTEQNTWLEEHREGFYRIDRSRDIQTTGVTNKYGMLYYTQRAFDLQGSVENLARWKEQGLRSLQITYGDSELGGGSSSDDLPLSTLGKQVVQEMNRLRMVVDVSHSGKKTTLDVCGISSRPVTANHANAERLTGHRRNKSDEELRAIAGTGGVVGITTINRFLLRNASQPATIDDFIAHLDYVVQLIGIDHVGIAGDNYMDGTQVYEVDFSDKWIDSYDRWKNVVRKLLKKGYTREDMQKILGLNFKRVLEQTLDP